MADDDASSAPSTPATPAPAPKAPAAKAPPKPKAAASPTVSPAATAAAPPKAKASPKEPAKDVAKEKAKAKAEEEEEEGLKAPKRATLEAPDRRLLALRRSIDRRRPKFVRTASHRYHRIGRWGSWRRPRGLQSKQRRHYGYRPTVVSIGFRTPRKIRGLTPTGFRPVLVRTLRELEELEPKRQAAVIAHGVGVRKRLVLEENARKRGVRVLNPILKEEHAT